MPWPPPRNISRVHHHEVDRCLQLQEYDRFFFLFPGILRFFCLVVQNSQWHASCESFQEKIYVSLEYPPVDEQCAAQY